MKLSGNGIIKRLYRQTESVGNQHGDPSFQQLDIQSVTPLLLILGTGIILAIFVLVSEIIVHRYFAEAHKIIIHRNGRTKAAESAKSSTSLTRQSSTYDRENKRKNWSEENGTRSDFKVSRRSSKKIRSGTKHEWYKELIMLRTVLWKLMIGNNGNCNKLWTII